jgi:hypothetical protein
VAVTSCCCKHSGQITAFRAQTLLLMLLLPMALLLGLLQMLLISTYPIQVI